MKQNKYKFETIQLHAGQEQPDPVTGARAVPVYATTSYVFENAEQAQGRFALTDAGNIYTRLTNPTTNVLEQRIAALEGGAGALAVASGMAAITYAIQNIAKAGDHIVSSFNIYGGTYNLLANALPDSGIETTFIGSNKAEDFAAAVKNNTKAIFIETLGNPNSDVADIEALAAAAHQKGIPLIVDNTFATPYLVRPIEHGADVVVHSATKFIGGHGTVIGGVIVDSGKFNWEQNDKFPGLSQPNPNYHGTVFTQAAGALAYILKIRATLLRDTGAVLSPFNAFALLQGIETLSLRMERHVENALKVVDFLNRNPHVERVNHPALKEHRDHALYQKYFPNGGGSIFTFEIQGGEQQAKQFCDSLHLFSLLANVADVKSLVIHPGSTTHSQMSPEELKQSGIQPNTVRLSIGTEHIDDILEDISQAFNTIFKEN